MINLDINEWKSKRKGTLIEDVKKEMKTRSGLTCDHCERQYDDDMCDSCFARRLVNMFQETLISNNQESILKTK